MSEALISAASGAAATTVSKTCFYPLDRIKTALQGDQTGASTVEILARIQKTRGLLSFYKGLNYKLVKSVSQKTAYFYIYQALSDAYRQALAGESSSVLGEIVIGWLGEALSLPLIIPLEAVVTKVQMQSIENPDVTATEWV